MTTLFTVYGITGSEVVGGVSSVVVLVPYYGLLYFLREKIHRQFRFMIRKYV
jgi:sigma-E factor negative regulatory protein RseC